MQDDVTGRGWIGGELERGFLEDDGDLRLIPEVKAIVRKMAGET